MSGSMSFPFSDTLFSLLLSGSFTTGSIHINEFIITVLGNFKNRKNIPDAFPELISGEDIGKQLLMGNKTKIKNIF